MAADAMSLRRRAAVAVLSPLLDEPTLLTELWQLQESMRGDAVSDIIACVDATARRQMFDAATCKRLYRDFHQALRWPDSRLPPDPWPAMQARQPAAPVAAAAPLVPRPVFAATVPAALASAAMPLDAARPIEAAINPVTSALAARNVGRGAVASTSAGASGGASEPPVVFGAMWRAVLAEVQRFHRDALDEVRNDVLAALERGAVAPALRPVFREAWQRPLQHAWHLEAGAADLAELTRLLHHALTAAFGRVGADQILQRGLQTAEQLPEARRFPPKRLQAAL